MSTAIPLDQLSAWLRHEIATGDARHTVVLAGHYAVFSGGARAVDFLGEADDPPPAAAEMLAFTKCTWTAACQALAEQRERGARLLVLVDDVAFVRPLAGDARVRERLGDALATRYLDVTPRLPAFHMTALAEAALSEAHVVQHSAARWTFSERELRIAHVRRLKDMLGTAKSAGVLRANGDRSEITASLASHRNHQLVHAGHANCAGGYLELLASLEHDGVRRVIALVPQRCMGPIATGTMLAHDLFSLSRLTVVNAAVPDPASGLPAAVLQGWGE